MTLFSSLRSAGSLPVEGHLPGFGAATGWLNSAPLAPADLDGKVVLVDFRTYTCINWLRTLAYVRAWAGRYEDRGLVVGRRADRVPLPRPGRAPRDEPAHARRIGSLPRARGRRGARGRARPRRRRAGPRDGGRAARLPADPAPGPIVDRTFEIAFDEPDVEAYVFTFG